jgi:hypothetical protein
VNLVVGFTEMKKIIGRIALVALGLTLPIALLTGFVATFCGLEMKCWWNPWIDTRCAPGFTERGFDSISNGMSKEQVRELLRQPLGTNEVRQEWYPYFKAESVEEWYYTSDGKCRWADWAWLGRYICFSSNGTVTEKLKVIHND